LAQVGEAFIARSALPIRTRDLGATRHAPRPLLFKDRSEFVAHALILPRPIGY